MKNEFVKNGRIEPGKTPSERQTGTGEIVKRGQALRKGEAPVKDLKDLEVPLGDE